MIENISHLPHDWAFFRALDYHETTPWAIVFVAMSPWNEAFVWDELCLSPEKNTTAIIAEQIMLKSKDYSFSMNLIDSLATKMQSNTGTSVVGDLNNIFRVYRNEGKCTGGVWESWDTKSTVGRDRIRERLMNAAICKEPFRNEVVKNDVHVRLPTLWIFTHCVNVAKSLQLWRLEGDKPAQAHSHFCTALEALMKDVRFKPKLTMQYAATRKSPYANYFNSR